MSTPDSTPTLRLLGGAVIQAGDTPLGGPAAHRHRIALLALLATTGRPMSRDKLVAYLWPERDTESARNLLKTAVHELRKLLGEAAIPNIGDQLSVDTARIQCDVVEFEAAIAAGDLKQALALYKGPFLDGFFLKDAAEFEHWAESQRTRLEKAHARAVERRRSTPRSIEIPRPQTAHRSPSRWLGPAFALVAVAVAMIAVVAWKRDRVPPAPRAPTPVVLADSLPGTALLFDGVSGNAGTHNGTVVTSQVDNITVDLLLRWDGRNKNEHQVIFYNGHGAVSGWGLLVTGRENGQEDGTIAVLAGGITIAATTLVLRRGVWQHLVAERRDGRVVVTLDDRSYAIGAFPVTPIGAKWRHLERTTVGGDFPPDSVGLTFRGAIDRVRIRDLASNYFIDRWNFNEGAGATTVGDKGLILYVGGADWTAAPQPAPRDAFWNRLYVVCGQSYPGRTTEVAQPGGANQRAPQVLHLYACEPNAIRFALHIGDDRSRTFVLTRTPNGLRLTHARHRPDGTRDSAVNASAGARDSGAGGRQEFVDATGARWTLEIAPLEHIAYTSRGGAGPLRLEFDLRRTVVSPPPPWSVRPH